MSDEENPSFAEPLGEMAAVGKARRWLQRCYAAEGVRTMVFGASSLGFAAVTFFRPVWALSNFIFFFVGIIVLREVAGGWINKFRARAGLTPYRWPLPRESVEHARRMQQVRRVLNWLMIGLLAAAFAPSFGLMSLAPYSRLILIGYCAVIGLMHLDLMLELHLWEAAFALCGWALCALCYWHLCSATPPVNFLLLLLALWVSVGAGELLTGAFLHARWKRFLMEPPPQGEEGPAEIQPD